MFDSFVATDKNISFLSDGKQYIADVEKYSVMNPSNTNNGKYNHWNIVNEDGDILHNLFSIDEFAPRSSVFTTKRGERMGTQIDRLDTHVPINGCEQTNLCQQTSMFFTMDTLPQNTAIKSDVKEYIKKPITIQTQDHPDGVSLSQLTLSTSGVVSHDEELRKYPSVKYMYNGYETVHEAMTNRFAPTGDFRTSGTNGDVAHGWQYLKNYNADEHIAIFNDIFDDQEVTVFGDAVTTKTYYNNRYSVDGREYVTLDDGTRICLNDGVDADGLTYVDDATMIDKNLNYTVVSVGPSQSWRKAFPSDTIATNIFEFTMKNVKWEDMKPGAMSFIVVDDTGLDIQSVPYEYLTHRGNKGYQIGARCVGGTLKVRFSIPYTTTMSVEQFKAWLKTVGTIKLKNNPSIADADARSKRFIALNGTEDWHLNGSALEVTFSQKCCDAFVRTRALARMPVKFSYIGATEKDFTQSVPFNSIARQSFKASGAALDMSDAALAGKCATSGDSVDVTIRIRFWRGSYDVTTVQEAKDFFAEHPLLIKCPSAADDLLWSPEEAVAKQDRFFPDSVHEYDVKDVRDYKQVDVCGPMLYLIYKHQLKTESEPYVPNGVNGEGIIPITNYSSEMMMKPTGRITSDDELDELMEDEDRNTTDIDVLANYETAESVNSINRLGAGSNSIKSNLFSISISNLGLDNNKALSESDKGRIYQWIRERVNRIAERLAPANTQLFKTFIND